MQSNLSKYVLALLPAAAFTAAAACSTSAGSPADAGAGSDASAVLDTGAPPEDQNVPETSNAGLTPDPTAPGRVTQFDANMAAAICERLSSCCTATDYQRYFLQFTEKPWELKTPPEPAACAATLATTLGKLHGKWASWAVRGSVKFDDARGAACIATLKAAACGEPLNTALFDDKCQGIRRNEVFIKQTPIGTSCEKGDSTYFGDCNPATGFCSERNVCTAWRKTGESCGTYYGDAGVEAGLTLSFCEPDHQCDNSTLRSPGRCTGASINVPLGGRCDAATGPLQICVAGTYCGVTGVCEAAKADGQTCLFDGECATERPYTCAGPTPQTRVCGAPIFCGGK